MAMAGHVEQTVSVGIWYMPLNTHELTCNCINKSLHELFIKPDVFSNLVPFIIPLITPNGVHFIKNYADLLNLYIVMAF